MIGGVELNPGPCSEEIIAALSTEAPSDEIRNCIRMYDPNKTSTLGLKDPGAAEMEETARNSTPNVLHITVSWTVLHKRLPTETCTGYLENTGATGKLSLKPVNIPGP